MHLKELCTGCMCDEIPFFVCLSSGDCVLCICGGRTVGHSDVRIDSIGIYLHLV